MALLQAVWIYKHEICLITLIFLYKLILLFLFTLLLQEDLIDVMPAVEEANSISEELDKRVKFEIILIRFVFCVR